MNKTIITLAVYNERENLPDLIAEILETVPEADILVIDDNSPDGTGVWAQEFAQTQPRVKTLIRPGKLGLGSAVIDAMKYSIENGYLFMVNMDADFSHQPKYLPTMLQTMYQAPESVAVVIGSRYVPGGGVQGWPLIRRAMSRCVNAYARFMLSLPVHDTSGSFRCYRVSVLKQLDFNAVQSRGYSFFEEILYWINKLQAASCGNAPAPRFLEIPITFIDRVKGKSKINKIEAVNALRILFLRGFENWFGVSLYTFFNRAAQTVTILYTIVLIILLVCPDPYFLLHGVPDPNTEESKFPTLTHSCVFILLGVLWEFSFFRLWSGIKKFKAWGWILFFAAVFEAIQIFVPSRTFDPVDVLQNVIGALIGLAAMLGVEKLLR